MLQLLQRVLVLRPLFALLLQPFRLLFGVPKALTIRGFCGSLSSLPCGCCGCQGSNSCLLRPTRLLSRPGLRGLSFFLGSPCRFVSPGPRVLLVHPFFLMRTDPPTGVSLFPQRPRLRRSTAMAVQRSVYLGAAR